MNVEEREVSGANGWWFPRVKARPDQLVRDRGPKGYEQCRINIMGSFGTYLIRQRLWRNASAIPEE